MPILKLLDLFVCAINLDQWGCIIVLAITCISLSLSTLEFDNTWQVYLKQTLSARKMCL